ncbi:hypothetical protein SBRCBS47491_003085 [Sporothrix bragantina]|uniref:Myb-like domain-containing protein n=1 Tax=Sporothrix bragantina TaxID=671064 RepID=A0ABP0BC36_9PEZI
MNSKNWNDRADKDLFFTILSVKNIGVISGAEWITIGHHMRTLGYGFSNEGCRQHFQGLRRAQNKIEPSNGTTPGSIAANSAAANKADPALNPITRRPGGPGRRRSRKLSSAAAESGGGSEDTNGNGQEANAVVGATTNPSGVDSQPSSAIAATADIKADMDIDAEGDADADAEADPDDIKAGDVDGEGEADPDAPIANSNNTLSAELVAAAAANGLEPLLAHTHPHVHTQSLQLDGNSGVILSAMDDSNPESAGATLHHNQQNPHSHIQHTRQPHHSSSYAHHAQQQHLQQQHHHHQQQQLHLQHQQHEIADPGDLSGLLAHEKLARQQLFQQQQIQEQQLRQHHQEQLLQQQQHLQQQLQHQQQQQQQQQQHQHQLQHQQQLNGNNETGGVVGVGARVGVDVGVGVAVSVNDVGIGAGLDVHNMPQIPAVPDGHVGEEDDDDEENEEENDDAEGQQVKRQKLEATTSLEDHAVLTALAAHNDTAFPPDFHYGEA